LLIESAAMNSPVVGLLFALFRAKPRNATGANVGFVANP